MTVSGQAAATRAATTAERLVELRARLDRLERGEPTTPSDVERARDHAASQQRAASVAQERLMITHRSVLDRHLRHVERSGDATRRREAMHRSHDAIRRYQELDQSRSVWEPKNRRIAAEEFASEQVSGNGAQVDLLKATLTAQFLWSGNLAADDLDRQRGWCEAVVAMSAARDFAGWVHAVCAVAASALPGVRGVSAVVTTDGGAEVTAASDEWTLQVQEVEFIVGEGPSATARDRSRTVFVADLSEQTGWQVYASAIAGHGVGGVCAVPVLVHGLCVGSLTFYGSSPLDGDALLEDTATFADIAAAATVADIEAIRLGDHRRDAHFSVHVATGVLCALLKITPLEAEARMRAHAFSLSVGLVDVAEQVLSGALDLS